MSMLIAMMLAVPSALPRDCEKGAETMSQVYVCLNQNNDARLDAAFRETLRVVRQRNKYAADQLVSAEKNWTGFAADSCAFRAYLSRRSLWDQIIAKCWRTSVDARIKVLEGYRRELTASQSR
jgi:uncharacterized protein YecT (DUF1311 family)